MFVSIKAVEQWILSCGAVYDAVQGGVYTRQTQTRAHWNETAEHLIHILHVILLIVLYQVVFTLQSVDENN